VLTIFDPTSKEALWSTVEHRRLARREKNREKETINAAQKLVNNLKARLGTN
jgi:5-formyltetrahydrofolate cyclo-ligase